MLFLLSSQRTITTQLQLGDTISLDSSKTSRGRFLRAAISAPGTGYAIDDVLTVTGGNNDAVIRVVEVDVSGANTVIAFEDRGSGYSDSTFPLAGGSGTSATLIVSSVIFYSPYSDDIPYEGYTTRSARSVIDSALNEINKKESVTLTDEFAFQQLDNCQTEVIQDLKRWSFMQLFDVTVAHIATGSWKFPLPDNIGTDNSNKSIYQLRVSSQQRLVWVDKQKFDEFLVGVAYTTLAVALAEGDATMTLVDSSTFNSLASESEDGTGMVTIGAFNYAYSANDTTTGIPDFVRTQYPLDSHSLSLRMYSKGRRKGCRTTGLPTVGSCITGR